MAAGYLNVPPGTPHAKVVDAVRDMAQQVQRDVEARVENPPVNPVVYVGELTADVATLARLLEHLCNVVELLPGPSNQPKTVHLSWRSAWRVGVMVWLALMAFAAAAVVVSAVAAAMLAQSVQP